MIIKEADGKSAEVAILEGLAARRDATPEVRKRIEQEIRNVRAGEKGEAEAAYEIDFHFGPSKNYAVIHDLRLEVDGRVAQIDHLVIGRFLDMWVCETKSFCEGIGINEQGEWSRFYQGKPHGMASPIEQNKRHMMVLEAAFEKGVVPLPRRLGISIRPKLTSVVLVSKNARISRPKSKIAGLESIIKCDQFRSMVERANESDNNPLTLAKLIGRDTLEEFARTLAAQHTPKAFDWAAKFGLAEAPSGSAPDSGAQSAAMPPPLPNSAAASGYSNDAGLAAEEGNRPRKKLVCATCAVPVELKVARFCWFNKPRFGGNIYCRDCQRGKS